MAHGVRYGGCRSCVPPASGSAGEGGDARGSACLSCPWACSRPRLTRRADGARGASVAAAFSVRRRVAGEQVHEVLALRSTPARRGRSPGHRCMGCRVAVAPGSAPQQRGAGGRASKVLTQIQADVRGTRGLTRATALAWPLWQRFCCTRREGPCRPRPICVFCVHLPVSALSLACLLCHAPRRSVRCARAGAFEWWPPWTCHKMSNPGRLATESIWNHRCTPMHTDRYVPRVLSVCIGVHLWFQFLACCGSCLAI